MNAAGSMSSASRRENSLVPGLVPGKKGGEIALPKCVHFHVSRSTFGLRLEEVEYAVAVSKSGVVRELPSLETQAATAESAPSLIGPINLGTKRAGARSAGNPHAACDVEGAGNGLRNGLRHRHKAKAVGNRYSPNLRPPRQSSTLLTRGACGNVSYGEG